jgi:NAD(P)-dependent dehydrogenase (short-subunit alcohol dehydrogenase family)
MTVLFIGHNGTLGRNFCVRHADKYKIVGVSRNVSKVPTVASVEADVSTCSIERLLQSVSTIHGEIDHVIYAASSDRGALMGSLTEAYLDRSIGSNIKGPLRVINALFNHWAKADKSKKSFCIVSSCSAQSVFSSKQSVYGPMKSAQAMMALHVAQHMKVRANALLPNSFPTLLPTEEVSDKLVELMEGTTTGKLILMGPDNQDPKAPVYEYVR